MPVLHHVPGDALVSWNLTGPGGSPLLCLPGLGMSAGYMAALAGHVSRPLALVDLPGTGGSEPLSGCRHDLATFAEIAAGVVEAIGEGPLDVFGHSLGGTVAIALAHARPDLVRSLVVAEANLAPGGGDWSRSIAGTGEDDFAETGFSEVMSDLGRLAKSGRIGVGGLYAACRASDPRALHQMARALVDLDPSVRDWFIDHRGPRAFLYGERTYPTISGAVPGPDVPDPGALEAEGVAVEIVPNAGHLMVIEAPEATAVAIARYL